jgi:hypothetical protein
MTDSEIAALVEDMCYAAYRHPDGWPFQMANPQTKAYWRAQQARALKAVLRWDCYLLGKSLPSDMDEFIAEQSEKCGYDTEGYEY